MLPGMDGSVRAITCPQCGAALTPPSRFAREAVCAFCQSTIRLDPSAVSVARFRQAFAHWNDPQTHGFQDWIEFGGFRFADLRRVGRGDHCDVFVGIRARPPTERVIVKLLAGGEDIPRFEREWSKLSKIGAIEDPAAGYFSPFVPRPVARGVVIGGGYQGRSALAYRDERGFVHDLQRVRQAYAGGVDPKVGVWLWRRTLEVLAFLHRNGVTHGDLKPVHLIVHRRDHAVRLVGFAPDAAGDLAADIRMSAEAVASVLPPTIPDPFGRLLKRIARAEERTDDALSLRERVGEVSRATFGASSYNPLPMPPQASEETS